MAANKKKVPARPRTINEFSPIPFLNEDDPLLEIPDPEEAELVEEFIKAHDEFADTLMSDLKGHLIKSFEARSVSLGTAGTFADRRARIKKRMRVQVDPSLTVDGEIDRTLPDGHADLKVTLGWTRENVRTASAQLRQKLFESSQRPFVAVGRGYRHENNVLERIATGVIDDLLERAKYLKPCTNMTRKSPADGTGILRYELIQRTRYIQGPAGTLANPRQAWQEVQGRPRPLIRAWPIENVYVTHWDQPECEDQQGVFWVTLNADEYTLGKDAVKRDPLTNEFQGGKYRNIQAVNEASLEAQEKSKSRRNQGTQGIFPTCALVEYEGPLPLLRYIKDGVLIQGIMDFYGVDVGMDPDPSNEFQMEEYGRRLQEIPVWHVAWTTEFNSTENTWQDVQKFNGHILLRVEPDMSREPHNSLFAFKWQPDDLNFMGLSINDLGFRIEDAADGLANADIWISTKNAHPTSLYSDKGLKTKGKAEVQRLLLQYDGLVESGATGQGHIDAREIIHMVQLPEIKDFLSKMGFYKISFDLATGVSPALKAQDTAAGTGTLGHVQLNLALAEIDVTDIVLAQAAEWCRLLDTIWRDITWYMAPDEFAEYAAEVSGLGISEVQKVLPSTEGLGNDVSFVHPLAAVADKTVLTTLLLRIRQVFPDADWDPTIMARRLVEFAGYPRSEEFFRQGSMMDPQDEQHQFARGNWIEPNMGEDALKHLHVHYQAFMALSQGLQQGGGGEGQEEQSVAAQLTAKHIEETMQMVERFTSMQGSMAGLAIPPGQQGAAGQGGGQQPLGLLNGSAGAGGSGQPRMLPGPTQAELGETPPTTAEAGADVVVAANARVT